MTRCKVGDLAVIVGSDFPENLGHFVHVVCLPDPDKYPVPLELGDWECEPLGMLRGWDDKERNLSSVGSEVIAINDADLRPIRNDPGQDESLSWCDVPTTDKAAA